MEKSTLFWIGTGVGGAGAITTGVGVAKKEKPAIIIGGLMTAGGTFLAAKELWAKPPVPPEEVAAEISSFTISPTSARPGDSIMATIVWKNTGTKRYAFDVVTMFDDRVDGIHGWGNFLENVDLEPGQTKTSNIEVFIPQVEAKKYDGYALICDARRTNEHDYEVVNLYDSMVKENMLEVMAAPVAGEVTGFSISPSTVEQGGVFTASVSWKNIGTQSYAFDLVAAFGHLVGNELHDAWACWKENVPSSPGQSQATSVPCGVPSGISPGGYDGVAFLCDAHIEGNTIYIDKTYHTMAKPGMLNVIAAAVSAKIEDFVLV